MPLMASDEEGDDLPVLSSSSVVAQCPDLPKQENKSCATEGEAETGNLSDFSATIKLV